MTDAATGTTEQTVEVNGLSELDVLKQRATLMGVNFSNNIKLETLRARVEAKMDGKEDPHPEANTETNALDASGLSDPTPQAETTQEIRTRLLRDCMKLVRVRITNMDPKKKDLPGEILTVGNEYIGTVQKYIPYGEASENGYHIPQILYEELLARKFLDIRTSKRGGQLVVSQGWTREFSLEVLPQLTEQELARLAAAQAAAAGASEKL